jgi:hypothetical protein
MPDDGSIPSYQAVLVNDEGYTYTIGSEIPARSLTEALERTEALDRLYQEWNSCGRPVLPDDHILLSYDDRHIFCRCSDGHSYFLNDKNEWAKWERSE